MFETKANARTLQFPVAEDTPVARPAWLGEQHSAPARTLFPPAHPAGEEPTRPASLSPSERHSAAPHRPSEIPKTASAGAPHAPQAHEPTAPHTGHTPATANNHAQTGTQPQAADPAAAHAAQHMSPTSASARAARPGGTEDPQAHAHAEHEGAERPLDERVWSRLPAPPQLGSLIPGARSAPPPANDTGLELLREQREAFTNAAVELGIARAATLAVLEGQLLDLSIEIASALIEREIEREPELHGTLARAALATLGDSERVMLRTSPEAYQAICQTLGGPEVTTRGVQVQVHADTTIPGLGCVVEGDNVRIDATVAERLRAVRRAFEEERRKVAESSE